MHPNYLTPNRFIQFYPCEMWDYFSRALDKSHLFEMKDSGVKRNYIVERINQSPHKNGTIYVTYLEISTANDPLPADNTPIEDTFWTCPTCGTEHI